MRKHRSIKSHLCSGLYTIADKLPSSQSRFGRAYKALRNRIAANSGKTEHPFQLNGTLIPLETEQNF